MAYNLVDKFNIIKALHPTNQDMKSFLKRSCFFGNEDIKNINCSNCQIFFHESDFSDESTIDMTSNSIKVVIPLCPSIAYGIYNFLGEILTHYEYNNNVEFILCSEDLNVTKIWLGYIYPFIIKLLDDYNIKYTIIDFSKTKTITVNNFYNYQNESNTIYPEIISKYLKRYIEDVDYIPNKKVYLSRKHIIKPDFGEHVKNEYGLRSSSDKRIDSHDELEKVMESLGFEVIVPESFLSFEDQINFFYKVSHLASLSGSGLANLIFMQPGQNVIEIMTPLIHHGDIPKENFPDRNDETFREEIHFFYTTMSLGKGHMHLIVPNIVQSIDLIKTLFYNRIKKFSKDSYEQPSSI